MAYQFGDPDNNSGHMTTMTRSGGWDPPGRPPSNTLTGVNYHNGGSQGTGPRPFPAGYEVQTHPDHWIYSGTGLNDGDVFGDIDQDGNDESVVGCRM